MCAENSAECRKRPHAPEASEARKRRDTEAQTGQAPESKHKHEALLTQIMESVCCICYGENQFDILRLRCGHTLCFGCWAQLLPSFVQFGDVFLEEASGHRWSLDDYDLEDVLDVSPIKCPMCRHEYDFGSTEVFETPTMRELELRFALLLEHHESTEEFERLTQLKDSQSGDLANQIRTLLNVHSWMGRYRKNLCGICPLCKERFLLDELYRHLNVCRTLRMTCPFSECDVGLPPVQLEIPRVRHMLPNDMDSFYVSMHRRVGMMLAIHRDTQCSHRIACDFLLCPESKEGGHQLLSMMYDAHVEQYRHYIQEQIQELNRGWHRQIESLEDEDSVQRIEEMASFIQSIFRYAKAK